jgi:hypothetical protein
VSESVAATVRTLNEKAFGIRAGFVNGGSLTGVRQQLQT